MSIRSESVVLGLVLLAGFGANSQAQGERSQPELGAAAAGAPDYSSVLSALQKELQDRLVQKGVPGAAVALVDGQELVWAGEFGFREVGREHPVTPETLFSIQSISKTYTATAFMRAVDQGRIGLDEHLNAVLPEFTVRSRFGPGEAGKITFRHLLSHWSGLGHEAPVGNNYGDWRCSFEEHVRSIGDSWLKNRIGERFRYSNLGVDLAGYALEIRLRRPFEQLMREELLLPLGMKASTFSQAEALRAPDRARGHIGGTQVPDLEVPMLAAGGMYSTARDMARFLSFHLARGRTATGSIVRPELLEAMYAPQFVAGDRGPGYGLGLGRRPFHGATLLEHGGGGYGYSAEQWWVPEHGIGIVILTNAEEGGEFVGELASAALRGMLAAKLGHEPPVDRMPWAERPEVAVPPEEIEALQGTYLAGFQVTRFQARGDGLYLVRGMQAVRLKTLGRTAFAGERELFEFDLDENGNPLRAWQRTRAGAVELSFSESPLDGPGPSKPEWSAFVGPYRARAYGLEDTQTVALRNGYLDWGGQVRLSEHAPGLFFTADGDSVQFTGDSMSFANRRYERVAKQSAGERGVPGKTWERENAPEQAGWTASRCDRVRARAELIGTAALLVVRDGKLLFELGDPARKYQSHSMRKSLLSALYGACVTDGTISLAWTLGELGIDDRNPLTVDEKGATIRDLLMSRSGVYHPAALETPDMALGRPARGSHAPGAFWYYNNWDFNALGTIFEQATSTTIFQAFEELIADAVEMEDYRVEDGLHLEGPESVHPGYPFRISTRDLARFGLLHLRRGDWGGKRILPAEWIDESTRAHSVAGSAGYGYMWWVVLEGKSPFGAPLAAGDYWAWGTGGHYLVVSPQRRMVIVHRVDTDAPGNDVTHEEFGSLLRLLIAEHD